MVKTRVTRRDLRREATKATVLEAARKVFLSEGFEGATIKAIADEAEVSPGTVLNAEPSKAALLVAILREECHSITESCEQMAAALAGPVLNRLPTLLHIILDGHARQSELFAAAVGHSWLSSDPAYHDAFEELKRYWAVVKHLVAEGKAKGELRADLDEEAAFLTLCDMVLGCLRAARRSDASDPREALTRRLGVVLPGFAA